MATSQESKLPLTIVLTLFGMIGGLAAAWNTQSNNVATLRAEVQFLREADETLRQTQAANKSDIVKILDEIRRDVKDINAYERSKLK